MSTITAWDIPSRTDLATFTSTTIEDALDSAVRWFGDDANVAYRIGE